MQSGFSASFVEKTDLFPLPILGTLVENHLAMYTGFISGFSILPHQFIHPSRCQSHVSGLLLLCSLLFCYEAWMSETAKFTLSLFKDCFALQGP